MPHDIDVDAQGGVWVMDGVGFGEQPPDCGHVVYEFSPGGESLRTLGTKGVAGDGRDTLDQPSEVAPGPARGHARNLRLRVRTSGQAR